MPESQFIQINGQAVPSRVTQNTSAIWAIDNPVLKPGEIGYEHDTYKMKIGNGETSWNDLPYTTIQSAESINLIDPTYRPMFAAEPVSYAIAIGSDGRQLIGTDNFVGIDQKLYLQPDAGSPFLFGHKIDMDIISPGNSLEGMTLIGQMIRISPHNDVTPPGTSTMYGLYIFSDHYNCETAAGIHITSGPGGSGSSGLINNYGISLGHFTGHNSSTDLSIGFKCDIVQNGPSHGAMNQGIRVRARLIEGTWDEFRGLSFDGWALLDEFFEGTLTKSSAIYADETIDQGDDPWFIQSLSKSPSYFAGKLNFDMGISSDPGTVEINKPSGRVVIGAGQSSLAISNSMVNSNSIVMAVIQDNDATALIKNVVVGSASFQINLSAAATNDTQIAFIVFNGDFPSSGGDD